MNIRFSLLVDKVIRKNSQRLRLFSYEISDLLRFFFAASESALPATEKRRILFIGDHMMARLPRMAKWLKRQDNIECILVTRRADAHKAFSIDEMDHVFPFRSNWQLKAILKDLGDVDIVHGFAPKSRTLSLVHKKFKKPLINDVQDLYVSNYGLTPPQLYMKMDLPYEKQMLEQADGIISQSLEVYGAFQTFGIQNRPPGLFFPLYCDEDYVVQVDRKMNPDDIHIVYAGGVYGSDADQGHFGNMKFFPLIETLSRQQLHFHIYPSPSIRPTAKKEYQQVAEENPYFHFHESVAQPILAKTLSQYHFGIIPFFHSGTTRSTVKRERGTSLKLFNFLEAGLPVLVSEDTEFQHWLLKRYGAAIPINDQSIHQARQLIEAESYPELMKSVLQNREKAMLGANIPRLLAFYDELCKPNTL